MVPALEVALALMFFANKALLIIGKRIGWLFGFVAAFFGIYYFFSVELYIFTVLEFGFATLMWYGYRKSSKESSARTEMWIRGVLTAVMALLTYFLFHGFMTVLEFVSTLFALWGAYLLTGIHVRWGWGIWSIGHFLSTIVCEDKGQVFFAHFQLASAILTGAGVLKGGSSVIESSA